MPIDHFKCVARPVFFHQIHFFNLAMDMSFGSVYCHRCKDHIYDEAIDKVASTRNGSFFGKIVHEYSLACAKGTYGLLWYLTSLQVNTKGLCDIHMQLS